MKALFDRFKHLIHELFAFGLIGGLAFIIELGLFNIFAYGSFAGINVGHAAFADKTITAKALATVVATVFAFLGNRYWTYRNRPRGNLFKELGLFGVANVFGFVIAAGTLAISHYSLGYTSQFADNVANILGIILATVFRFFAYRILIFKKHTHKPEEVVLAAESN